MHWILYLTVGVSAALILCLVGVFVCGLFSVVTEMPPSRLSRDEPPALDAEYAAIKARLDEHPGDPHIWAEAHVLALKIRSRCIDLATIKADYEPEYQKRVSQASDLVRRIGSTADEKLLREFGILGAAHNPVPRSMGER